VTAGLAPNYILDVGGDDFRFPVALAAVVVPRASLEAALDRDLLTLAEVGAGDLGQPVPGLTYSWSYSRSRDPTNEADMTDDQRAMAPILTTREAWGIATQWKTNTPCADCGITYPYWVMQLDHVPERGAKSFTVSLTYTSGRERRVLCTREQLFEEIAKCDVVCANCHAERTHSRGGQRWGPPQVVA
jgi:hypothetical protein